MATRRARAGRGKSTESKIKEARNESDNKMAMQALVICVVVVGLVFGLMSLGDDDKKPSKRKNRNAASFTGHGVGGSNVAKAPDRESEVPAYLVTEFFKALATMDTERVEQLIWWERLFEQLDRRNNRDPEQSYAVQDEATQANLRDKYLLRAVDEEYAEMVRKYILEDVTAGNLDDLWGVWSVEPEFGNISIEVKDERNKKLVTFIVRTELKTGFDSVSDAHNRDAWGIVGLKHEQHNKLSKSGKKIRSSSKDFGEDIYKRPRSKRKKRGPKGPPEADPKTVAWLEGTSPQMKSKVETLIGKLCDMSHPREADIARDELISLEKTAIPGVLNALAILDHKEDVEDIKKGWQLIQVMRLITDKGWKYSPMSSGMAFGMGGMTRCTPEERVQSVRRWFGWWEKEGATWTKAAPGPEEEETWDDLDK